MREARQDRIVVSAPASRSSFSDVFRFADRILRSAKVEVVKFQTLFQHEQQLLAQVTFQASRDFLATGAYAVVFESDNLCGSRSPAMIARRIAIPVTPLMSLITLANCTFICVSGIDKLS